MSGSAEELLEQAMTLPDEDRLLLAEALLSSLGAAGPPPFDPEWLSEAKRRAARIDSGEAKLSSWADVRERARRSAGGASGG